MLKSDIHVSHFGNGVIPDQLASEKPADQDPHCFPLYLEMHAYKGCFTYTLKPNRNRILSFSADLSHMMRIRGRSRRNCI